MSKLQETWDAYLADPRRTENGMDAAITEAEETIARLTRERDEALARVKVMEEALTEIESQAKGHKRSTLYNDGINVALENIETIAARAARKEPTE